MSYTVSQCSLCWFSTANDKTLIILPYYFFYNISSLCEIACVQEREEKNTKLSFELKIWNDPTELTIAVDHSEIYHLCIVITSDWLSQATLTLDCACSLGWTWSQRRQNRFAISRTVQESLLRGLGKNH